MGEYLGLSTVLTHALAEYAQAHTLRPQQWKACRHIQQCRTAALGGTVLRCPQCGTETAHYHACRDRHCPRCQRQATEYWCARQRQNLLPVRYHHLVFTLPHELNDWVQCGPETVYRALFASAWQTLNTFAQDPKRLGGQLGAIAILHTWGQTLIQHIHLHVLVPGGVVTDQGQWRASKTDSLFPVRALSRHFRGKMVSLLRQAHQQGQLEPVNTEERKAKLDALMEKDWVVYSKPVLTRPETLIDYLGRYTHRIALSDSRLQGIDHGKVQLSYKDYRHRNQRKTLVLDEAELIRRMLLHVLPKGFKRIRHYGFLASACRERRLKQIRHQLKDRETSKPKAEDRTAMPYEPPCPKCKTGRLKPHAILAPRPHGFHPGLSEKEKRRSALN